MKGKRGDARSDLYSTGGHALRNVERSAALRRTQPAGRHELPSQSSAPLLSRGGSPGKPDRRQNAERDPERRYATAFELALDLDRPDQAIFADCAPVHGLAAGIENRKALFYSGLIMVPTAILALLTFVARHQ